MSTPVQLARTSLEAAVGASAVALATALTPGLPGVNLYQLASNTAMWWAQGIADTVFTAVPSTFTTAAPHLLSTGYALTVSNSGGALPTGLTAATVYWAIVLTPTTFQLATTLANALAGTNLTISTNGTGTQTATTTATAAAGSAFLPANVPILLDGNNGAKVSVIQDAAGGKASITQVQSVR